VFYRLQDGWAELYVLDEYNALWQQRLPLHDETHLLLPLQRFLRSMVMRRDACLPLDGLRPASLDIHYASFCPLAQARHAASSRAGPDRSDQPYYEVQAIIRPGRGRGACHAVLRSAGVFRAGAWRPAVCGGRPADHWPAPRRRRYRCYITDLDLSELLDDRLGATQVYLSYKRVLEQAESCRFWRSA
jgi:adenylate cyclase class 1